MASDKAPPVEELAYQSLRAARMGSVQATPPYVFERYARNRLWRYCEKEFVFRRILEGGVTSILEFGSGEGEMTTQLAKPGLHVTAVDISPELTAIAERRAVLDEVRDRVEFVVGDILEMPRLSRRFDCLFCASVLHHVNLYDVFPTLLDMVTIGGLVIVAEPIAFSPWLQRVRDALPLTKDISPGERQLSRRDIEFVLQHLERAEMKCFTLLGRLSRFFPNANKIDKDHPLTKAALVGLWGIDRALLDVLPVMRRFAGTVVIVGRKRG